MLEKIILQGFKSFSKRIEVKILPGITAFVGPNGCGKSNIGDAIKWALGEQSTKALRSERKIDEVIFHGSEVQKGLKMADVTLIFRNEVDIFEGNSDESIITRRVFASGESQYLINNNICRLKDIQELIYKKGISVKNYSIIPQGKIEQIIDSSGYDRRIMIEEASGIIKYKIHKKESLNKLEIAEDNLLRINDILNEIKSNLNSLKRQKTKAEAFKKLNFEKKKVEFLLKKSEYLALESSLIEKNRIFRESEQAVFDLDCKLKKYDEEYVFLKTESEICKEQLDNKNNLISDSSSKINQLKTRMDQLSFQVKELLDSKVRMTNEAVSLTENLKIDKKEYKNLENNLISTSKEMELKEKNLESLDIELAVLKEAIESMENNTSKAQKEILRYQSEIINHKNWLRMFDNEKKNLENRINSINNTISTINNEITDTKTLLCNLKLKSKANIEKLKSFEKQKESLNLKIMDIRKKLENAVGNLDSERRTTESLASRLQSLKELRNNLEGFQEGIKAIIELRKKEPEVLNFSGSHPFLFENINCDEKYEIAIQAALGEKTQGLVFERFEDIKKSIEYLKKNDLGRGTFIYNNPDRSLKIDNIISDETSEIRAKDVVHCEEQFKDLLDKLTKDMVVVDSLDKALNCMVDNKNSESYITLDGDIVNPDGTIIGGSRNSLSSNLLQREREIKDLEKQIVKKDLGIKKLETKIISFKSKLSEFVNQIENVNKIIYDEKIKGAGFEKEIEQLELNLERSSRNQSTYKFEQQQHKQSLKKLEDKGKKTENELLKIEETHIAKETEFKSMETLIKEKKKQFEKIYKEANQIKIYSASLNQKIISFKAQKDKLESFINERSSKIESLSKSTDEAIKRIEKNNSEFEIKHENLKKFKKELEIIQKEANLYQGEYLQITSSLNTMEAKIKESQTIFQKAKDEKNRLEIEKTRLETELQHIIIDVARRFEIDIKSTDVKDEIIDSNLALKSQLEKITNKLEKIGEVNLVALDEFNRQKERFEFLTKQKEDLIQSIDTLKTAIKKINKTTQEKFTTAYTEINENYKAIFKELFEGGEADLSFEKPDQPLETGIAIRAQPSGKQLKFISQLSGGEKVLTALSLLLAIFLYKPSPFCVLDEVDASLDDSNIWRFVKLLRKFSEDTQFLIISHNQHTIESANLIYGITMEDGMSRVISLPAKKVK